MSKLDQAGFVIFGLVFVSRWLWTWHKSRFRRVDYQSPYGAHFYGLNFLPIIQPAALTKALTAVSVLASCFFIIYRTVDGKDVAAFTPALWHQFEYAALLVILLPVLYHCGVRGMFLLCVLWGFLCCFSNHFVFVIALSAASRDGSWTASVVIICLFVEICVLFLVCDVDVAEEEF